MSGNRCLAAAALFAGVALASTSAAPQTMYRCGNKYQDKPCDDGQKGRTLGTTPAPAAPSKSGQERPASRAVPKAANASQETARKCVTLRHRAKDAKPRQKEDFEGEMRRLGCAYAVDGGLQKEQACASAPAQEAAATCRVYDKRS